MMMFGKPLHADLVISNCCRRYMSLSLSLAHKYHFYLTSEKKEGKKSTDSSPTHCKSYYRS